MKKRNVMIGTMMLLVVLLIGGGTLAYFSASATPVTNQFDVGILEIELIDEFCPPDNVNPGLCYDKVVKVKNTGTKKALVKVCLDEEWIKAASNPYPGELDLGVVEFEIGEGWVKCCQDIESAKVGTNCVTCPPDDPKPQECCYYWDKVLEVGETTGSLFCDDEICFNGPNMTNEYMGAHLNLEVSAEAIQATSDAPEYFNWCIDVDCD